MATQSRDEAVDAIAVGGWYLVITTATAQIDPAAAWTRHVRRSKLSQIGRTAVSTAKEL